MIPSLTKKSYSPHTSATINSSSESIPEQIRDIICNQCKKPKAPLTCGRCKVVSYCDKDCQKKDWKLHKLICAETTLSILSSFTSKNEKIRKWQIPLYFLNPSYLPKNSLFQLSDLAESVGVVVVNELARQLHNKMTSNLIQKNEPLNIPSSQLLKLYNSALNKWIEEAEATKDLSVIPDLEKLKAHAEIYFNHPKRKGLNVSFDELTACVKAVHGEMVNSLWLISIPDYSNYEIKNIPELFLLSHKCTLSEMNCVAFAFSMIGEKKIKNLSQSHLSELLKNLDLWNYYPVMDPQDSDLVVYFDAVTKEPTHIGVFTKALKVCSKPGFEYTFAVEHPLNHLSKCYGTGIAFFRKKS